MLDIATKDKNYCGTISVILDLHITPMDLIKAATLVLSFGRWEYICG
jgi:hypothetical protein